ncbi:MAG: RNA-binding S4 domain-containing protein [Oscillospiraceae bacterium]|nr:RNA-binding S4 domain-containing protein [Clostridiaceae bacterium]MDO4495767.1 RNA-binding S4 domain-containing protein [Clostridiaceae bacterium]MDY5949103.1 RNA-binding S4 domain-containing protein [Oscillospiraceae bacterium]
MKIKVKVAEKKQVSKKISTDFIKLDSFLKMCDAVQTGGHAKMVIQDGEVKVNGEVCTQRGKKLRKGDFAEFERTVYTVE